MERIALPTKECRGVDVPDVMGNPTGQVYRSRQPGYVEVDNPRHAQLIRRSIGQMASITIGFDPRLPGRSCDCGRENFAWQDTCGRCGKDLSALR